VLFCPDDKDDVARFHIRSLITLTREGDLLVIPHTRLNDDLKHLLVRHDVTTLTVGTSVLVVDAFTGSVTIGARHLGLCQHRTHSPGDNAHTATTATLALAGRLAVLAARTMAVGAKNVAGDGNVRLLAVVQILQSDIQRVNRVLTASWAIILIAKVVAKEGETGTKERAEDITCAPSLEATLFDTLLAVTIIDLTLLFITEDIISFTKRLELLLSSLVARVPVGWSFMAILR